MTINERLCALRKQMQKENVDYYLVPTADFHQSEYVGDYFKARKYITGFTGSAGTALIGREKAYLWTDGRYFIQAANELSGSAVELMRMQEPGVPTIEEFMEQEFEEGTTLGFDGRVVSAGEGERYEEILSKKKGNIQAEYDLIDRIWEDRPSLSKKPAFALCIEYTGESAEDKLGRVRKVMTEKGADVHVLTTLDDICWLLNVRGDDVSCFPLLLSYAVITMEKVSLYVDESKFTAQMVQELKNIGVEFCPYDRIYQDVKELAKDSCVLYDSSNLNYRLYRSFPLEMKVVDEPNPEIMMKCIKNPVEIENIRIAELKDSVAHVRFMKWLKENYKTETITELSATDKLEELRAEMGNYIRPSFDPISSYGAHSAMCHYSSTPETNVVLEEGGLYLTDMGAGYYEGSTDITRTYAIGEVPKEQKEHFTLVAMSNLRMADAKFMKGCQGTNLDIIARAPFWERGLNYNHGTGHGVGYLLNIHEGPANLRWQHRDGEGTELCAGMILTDEPGIYIEGSHGIRLENEILVCEGEANEYGQFMHFEVLTFVPMDLDAIEPAIMTSEDKARLNAYHEAVYEKVSPYLNEEEKEWLKVYTRKIA